ncbi:sensor histidine kinase [Dyadobacter frigoris]|uniref:histidine kinase n=1 Tax=Dyadobacter frigoris TaxID=2576211 RepID=A0A4U6DEB3_9BACT|nr:ATP-binding protein [Dyadobacter frigoris]TKT92834.1 HAMP domain-containing protein [Dyadobacter frigoris]GLU54400.1 two-component sensor histidine kinase [Dyadobacter frigoris]
MTTSFKNKIALNFTLSTALLIAVVFLVIYSIVNLTVFGRLEKDLSFEAKEHLEELGIKNGIPYFEDKIEWLEREHLFLEINPIFVQLSGLDGKVIDKSPNLKTDELKPDFSKTDMEFFRTKLLGRSIGQMQIIVKEKSKKVGYLVVAFPIDESERVMSNLQAVLLISFPAVLLLLFLITRYMAGRSIEPVLSVIDTADKITNENLTARIPLPARKDELKKLVITINALMDRIENAVDREKQFTSDASHELRTPLAIIKGTLEVLIRKPRTSQEYIDKVSYCINEINRINYLVDQLLLLARFESQKKAMDSQRIDLSELTEVILIRQQEKILAKSLSITLKTDDRHVVYSDPYMLDIIIENLISNAVKYSSNFDNIMVYINLENQKPVYKIIDHGIGIAPAEIEKIKEPFYRSNPLGHPEIKGNGLGLSIVKRMSELLNLDFLIESELNKGTSVSLIFNS